MKYVAVRDDRYVVITTSRRRAERVLRLYKSMKWSRRMRWLAIHGNVVAYLGRRKLEPGVYTVEEFRKAIEGLTPKWRGILEEELKRPVVRSKRPTREKRETPVLRVILFDMHHLRLSRFGSRYMVPRPLRYDYNYCDNKICGISEFKETVWFWVQDDDTLTVIVKKGANQGDLVDALDSLNESGIMDLEYVCDLLGEFPEWGRDTLATLCALFQIIS